MSEVPKAYEPQTVEDKWYAHWLAQGCFTADPASPKAPYSIVIPPPNVTGVLHMGHVLNNTIQDILARKARMDGKEVLWLPGTDHAGIATQVQVERALKKEEKKSKHDLGREEFLKRVWQWKEKHGGIIIEQLKKLGCSCDWTRERFTMDPEYSRCVQKVFVELYKKGLIYRGKRMVNWCPATQTALSDEEVIMKEQKGSLYYFKVQVAGSQGAGRPAPLAPNGGEGQGEGAKPSFGPVTDSAGRTWLTIATTRPETIPADTGVAVNPKDPRYAHLIGQHAVRPLPPELPREQRLIPIVGDESVDFEFGTGVLKVTPAHDKTDFDIGQRHKLGIIEAINADGTMSEAAGVDLKGLDRFKARKVAVEQLKELGALEKEEPYTNNVGYSERADVPIEPRLSEQWFLKYPSVEQAKACVEQAADSAQGGTGYQPVAAGNLPAATPEELSGRLPDRTGKLPVPPGKMHFHPQRWAKVYAHWLANIQDWCISRQLWWGHRIPVWTKVCRREEFHKNIMKQAFGEVGGANYGPGTDIAKSKGDKGIEFSFSRKPGELSFVKFALPVGGRNKLVVLTDSPAEAQCLNELGFEQDPDVLDTWFSSWLWPFATMGWPEQTATLKRFYPTTDLVTGPDIIFFWVARMIMAGYEFMGDLPFRDVYFTGIIRDKQGRKMSKTLGNSPDPLELIGKYGADALRFGTMRSAPLGQDVLFDEKDVELGRNFCNKLWNACRFRQMQGGEVQGEIQPTKLTGDDKWILLKLNIAITELTESLGDYKFSEAAQTLYRFFWSEFCDWYLEAAKATLGRGQTGLSPSPLHGERAGVRGDGTATGESASPPHPDPLPPAKRGGEGIANEANSLDEARRANTLAVMDFVLSHTLRLLHPFLPFITEELWHGMGYREDMPAAQGGQSIMFAPWPKPLDETFRGHYGLDDCYLEFADRKYALVTLGRNLRRESAIAANKKVRFVLKPAGHVSAHDVSVLKILLNAEAFDLDANYAPLKGTPTVHSELGELFLPKEGLVDVAAEKARLTKELAKIEAEIVKTQEKLANPAFVQKVPPAVLQEHQKRLVDFEAKQAHLKSALAALEG